MDSGGGIHHWTVWDGVKRIPKSPDVLMGEINSAISTLEYARATRFLESPFPLASTSNASNANTTSQYDTQMAEKDYKTGLAAMAAGNLDEAVHSLNSALSKCPPDKTAAVSKLQSLISHTSHQLQKSSK
ncbi:hypothetical protein LIER_34990 [Lithospermum erythrorhizon]|uniref:Uncharacterized protein n=1 Tax=Lithospermum erythrorhizon TaxID=34254 RepID=A0AAV3NHQ4_LITER